MNFWSVGTILKSVGFSEKTAAVFPLYLAIGDNDKLMRTLPAEPSPRKEVLRSWEFNAFLTQWFCITNVLATLITHSAPTAGLPFQRIKNNNSGWNFNETFHSFSIALAFEWNLQRLHLFSPFLRPGKFSSMFWPLFILQLELQIKSLSLSKHYQIIPYHEKYVGNTR